MKLTRCLLLLFLSPSLCNAQPAADSLKNLLNHAKMKGDEKLVNYHTAYLGYYYHSNKEYDSAITYYYRLLEHQSDISDSSLVAIALNGIGASYSSLGFPDSSLMYYDEALNLFTALKDTTRSIDVESNIAIVYKDLGLYEKALESAFSLLNKLEHHSPGRALASCYTTTAYIYDAMEEYNTALHYHRKSLQVRRALEYRRGEAQSLNNIGEIYIKMHQYDSALSNLQKSLSIKQSIGDKPGYANTLNNIGRVYLILNKLDDAQLYFSQSLEINRASKDKVGQAITLNDLGQLKLLQKKPGEASLFLDEAGVLSRESRSIETLKKNLEIKINLYKTTSRHAMAFKTAEELMSINDSLLNSEKSKNLKSLSIQYETEKKAQQILLLEQQDKISKVTIYNKQIMINALIAGVMASTIIAALVYRNFRMVRKNKVRIETLLREVHHRVKNFLQIMSSLLTLQSEQITDERARLAVKSSESRVNAMALIHRKLYNVDQTRSINIKDYITELVDYLLSAYGYHETQIQVTIDVPPLEIDVDKVIPLGLILNELISNALKYAYIDHPMPKLDISLSKVNASLSILIKDNGKGIDNTAVPGPTNSFGLKLTTMLIKELHGKLALSSTVGTQYVMSVPLI